MSELQTVLNSTFPVLRIDEIQTSKQISIRDKTVTIETEKTTLDIEARISGYLLRITAQEGDVVPISQVIGYIADSADEMSNN